MQGDRPHPGQTGKTNGGSGRSGDRHWQAQTWDSLGYAHHHLGQHTQAITRYQHALDLIRAVCDR